MQSTTAGEVKANFSEVLEMIQRGKDVVNSFSNKKEKIAMLVPFSHYQGKRQRSLGLLTGKAISNAQEGFLYFR